MRVLASLAALALPPMDALAARPFVTDDARLGRDELSDALGEQGIGSGIYYPRAAYDYDCYRTHPGVVIEPMPRAERAAAEVLSLPVHPFLSDGDLDRIGDAVRSLLS